MKNRLPLLITFALFSSLLFLGGCKRKSADHYDPRKPRRHDDFFQKAHGEHFIQQRRAELAREKKKSFELPQKRRVAQQPVAKLPSNFVVPKQVKPSVPKVTYNAARPQVQNIKLGKKDIQGMLRSLGFYSGPVDGKFGKKSIKAIKNFQSRNNLKVDGVAGTATKKTLLKKAWSSNKADLNVQMMLRQLGYYKGPIDGVSGKMTKTAVKSFQRANGLKVDGVAGRKTQAELRRLTGGFLASNA